MVTRGVPFNSDFIPLNWKAMAPELPHIQKKKVVIVGGGVAGSLLAKCLQYHAEVILIDPKEYFEIPWARLRSMVEPSFAERAAITHTDYFKHGRVITSSAVKVTENNVFTSENRCIAYDFLVIATGNTYSLPLTRADRLQQFQKDYLKIQSSRSILVIGGGPTGVELAGELAMDFPDKKVTLIHNGPRLLEFIGSRASNKALYWLRSKKVDVLLNQTVNLDSRPDDRVYETSANKTIEADCHFLCAGDPTGSSWLKGTMLEDSLDNNGKLIVDEYLRIRGYSNIFAIGDITSIPEMKQGYLAQKHALVVAKNIKRIIKDKHYKMEAYKPKVMVTMVSLGRKDAVAQFPLATISGSIPGRIKSKDLFVGKTRKNLGLDQHF